MSPPRIVDLGAIPSRADAGDARGHDRAAELGDDVFGDDPTVNALQARIGAARPRGGAVRQPAARRQPVRADGHCQSRRRYLVGQLAHLPLRGRRRGGAGQPQPQPNRTADGTLALADIEAAIARRRPALRAHACCAWRTPGTARCCAVPGLDATERCWRMQRMGWHTPRRRAPVQRIVASGAGTARRAAASTACRCASAGLGAPVGSGAGAARGSSSPARPHAQDGRRRHAPGRAAGGAALTTRSTTTSSAWPTTTRSRGASPTGWPACPASRSPAADQHRLRRGVDGGRGAALLAHLLAARRARHRPDRPALRDPPGRRRGRRRPRHRRDSGTFMTRH